MEDFIEKLSFKEKLIFKLLLSNNGYIIKNGEINLKKIEYTLTDGTSVMDRNTTLTAVNLLIFQYFKSNPGFLQKLMANMKEDNHHMPTLLNYFVSNLRVNSKEDIYGFLEENMHLYKESFHFEEMISGLSPKLKIKMVNKLILDSIDLRHPTKDTIKYAFELCNKYDISAPILLDINEMIEDEELSRVFQEELERHLEQRISKTNLSHEEQEVLKKSALTLFRMYKNGKLDKEVLLSNISSGLDYNNITSIARSGTIDLGNLNVSQISNINVKNLKQVLNCAETQFGEEFNPDVINNLYILFGKQRSIELLSGKYGEISFSMLENMFGAVNLSHYIIPNRNGEVEYTPEQKELISFFFASGPNDVNANIKKIISGEISSQKLPVARLIDEWESLYMKSGGHVSLSRAVEWLNKSLENFTPDMVDIESTLKKAGRRYAGEVVQLYDKMTKRTTSTIPKVKGSIGDLEYEMLDLNDPRQMEVGYDTHCCFTFGGASESSLEHACSAKNGRIFVVRKNGDIIAQSWVWRNGNVMCYDNIETSGLTRKNDSAIWEAYRQASDEIVRISSEHEERPIEMVTVGVRYSKIKLNGDPVPQEQIVVPDKVDYTDATEQVLVSKKNMDITPHIYDVEPIYQDPRKKVLAIDPQQIDEEKLKSVNNHVNKINYLLDPKNSGTTDVSYEYTFLFCGSDWFVGITTTGDIVQKSVSNDPRAQKELKDTLQVIDANLKSGTLEPFINDNNSSTIGTTTFIQSKGK